MESDGAHTARSFGRDDHRVQGFMVSKEFFINAVKAWMHSPFRNVAEQILEGIDHSWDLTDYGLFLQFRAEMDTFSTCLPDRASSCMNLKVLRLVISSPEFGQTRESVCHTELQSDDFEKMHLTKVLKRLRGLRVFELYPASSLNSPLLNEKFQQSLKDYEAYIRSFVLLPKTRSTQPKVKTTIGTSPLYLGSRVCSDSSKLLPADYYLPDYYLGSTADGDVYPVSPKYRVDTERKA